MSARRPLARAPARLAAPAALASVTALWRQPAFVAIDAGAADHLAAAVRRAVPGLSRTSPGSRAEHGTYLEFITPGVVVMTALFSSGWAGTVYIEDMNRGVMDRLLASRSAAAR